MQVTCVALYFPKPYHRPWQVDLKESFAFPVEGSCTYRFISLYANFLCKDKNTWKTTGTDTGQSLCEKFKPVFCSEHLSVLEV